MIVTVIISVVVVVLLLLSFLVLTFWHLKSTPPLKCYPSLHKINAVPSKAYPAVKECLWGYLFYPNISSNCLRLFPKLQLVLVITFLKGRFGINCPSKMARMIYPKNCPNRNMWLLVNHIKPTNTYKSNIF